MMLKNVKMPIVAGGGSGNRHSLKSALKRGFTIMELVIVIAVIAVLAAVLIPTFANLTERANESADLQTVENLNTILRADETIDGEKPATMQEALEHALSGGYNVSALTPTSDGNSILWNQEDNRFVLADSETGEIIAKDDITTDTTATGYKYWAVVGDSDDLEVAEAKSFSRYYTSADVITDNAVSANAGVDVSALETAVEIEYTNTNTDTEKAQDVIINGNGGALTVNADTDTVSAYGVFSSVDGKAVADESLHIYAEVTGNISIADGRLVIETGSSAAGVLVTGASVTIVVNDAANLGTIAAATDVSVELDSIVTNNTNTPTSEIISTTPVDTTIADNFAGGIGTEASPYLIATAEQFKNIKSGTADNIAYYILVNDIDLNDEIEIYHLYNAGKGVPCFYGDSAKELDYVKISGATDSGISALTMPVETEVTNYWVFLFNKISNCEFSDLIIKYNMPETSAAFSQDSCSNVTFKNVDTYGEAKLPGRNCGLYVYYADNCKFIGCDNYADIDAGADINGTIYVGVPSGGTIEFTDCNNYGTIKGQMVGMFYGNGYNAGNVTTLIANCNNFGLITSTSSQKDKSNIFGQTSKGIIKVQNNNGEFEEVDDLTAGIIQNCVRMADSQFKVEINGEDISVTKANDSNAVKYVVELGFYITSYDENGISLGTGYFVVEQEISFNEENTCVAELKYLSFVPESSDYNETDKSYVGQNDTFEAEVVVVTDADGASHYMVKLSEIQTSYDIKTEINPTCKVKTYDTNGNLLYAVIAE